MGAEMRLSVQEAPFDFGTEAGAFAAAVPGAGAVVTRELDERLAVEVAELAAKGLDDAAIAVLHLEQHPQVEVDIFGAAVEEASFLRALTPVEVEHDLTEP